LVTNSVTVQERNGLVGNGAKGEGVHKMKLPTGKTGVPYN